MSVDTWAMETNEPRSPHKNVPGMKFSSHRKHVPGASSSSFIQSIINQQAPAMRQAPFVSVHREATRRDKTPCPQDAPIPEGPRRSVGDLLSHPGFPEELPWSLPHREFSFRNGGDGRVREGHVKLPSAQHHNPGNPMSTPAWSPLPPCSQQAQHGPSHGLHAPPPPTPWLHGHRPSRLYSPGNEVETLGHWPSRCDAFLSGAVSYCPRGKEGFHL